MRPMCRVSAMSASLWVPSVRIASSAGSIDVYAPSGPFLPSLPRSRSMRPNRKSSNSLLRRLRWIPARKTCASARRARRGCRPGRAGRRRASGTRPRGSSPRAAGTPGQGGPARCRSPGRVPNPPGTRPRIRRIRQRLPARPPRPPSDVLSSRPRYAKGAGGCTLLTCSPSPDGHKISRLHLHQPLAVEGADLEVVDVGAVHRGAAVHVERGAGPFVRAVLDAVAPLRD